MGYKPKAFNNLQLALGTPISINAVLISEAKSLSEVVVTSNQNAVMSPNHQGVATHISQQQLQDLPTVSRSIADFTRLTPQAVNYNSGSDGSSMGTSFGGANNRYNQFSVDGANATDVFGLAASGTNGGQPEPTRFLWMRSNRYRWYFLRTMFARVVLQEAESTLLLVLAPTSFMDLFILIIKTKAWLVRV